ATGLGPFGARTFRGVTARCAGTTRTRTGPRCGVLGALLPEVVITHALWVADPVNVVTRYVQFAGTGGDHLRRFDTASHTFAFGVHKQNRGLGHRCRGFDERFNTPV